MPVKKSLNTIRQTKEKEIYYNFGKYNNQKKIRCLLTLNCKHKTCHEITCVRDFHTLFAYQIYMSKQEGWKIKNGEHQTKRSKRFDRPLKKFNSKR